MQNSGIGNIVNPVTSLLDEKVYGIPCIYIVGWRGEPQGTSDEPQHIFQGAITLDMFKVLGIATIILDKETKTADLKRQLEKHKSTLDGGKSIAIVVKKDAFDQGEKFKYSNNFSLVREDIIERITKASGEDIIVCTTGKASRELFEIRVRNGQSHKRDFLTVGSMGHSSSIALGLAKVAPDKKVWCIDGDGSVLMHMGAMAVVGASNPPNLIHIVINNQAHETVGGMPTAATAISFTKIAEGCGYPVQICVCKDR
jgi:phosphonopyruvate decarboxylase